MITKLRHASCAILDNHMARVSLCLAWLSIVGATACIDTLPLPSPSSSVTKGRMSGPVQIIVPSYRFTCRTLLVSITVRVNGTPDESSPLYAQIWRPTQNSSAAEDYHIVWSGKYPVSIFETSSNSQRNGDNVTFYTTLGEGFPIMISDVVGLRGAGQGFQLVHTASPGGMNFQAAVGTESPCNISLCSTDVVQGEAPLLTVETTPLTGTIPVNILTGYSDLLTCTSTNVSCPRTLVPAPVATPTVRVTPSPPSTTTSPPSTTTSPPSITTSSDKTAQFPTYIAISVPAVLFVVMVTAVVVLVIVLCIKRKRDNAKKVDCVALSGSHLDQSGPSVPGIGGYSRDLTPNGQEAIQLRHMGPHPSSRSHDPLSDGSVPHHYSILEIETEDSLLSPSTMSPAASLPPPPTLSSIASPVPTILASAPMHAESPSQHVQQSEEAPYKMMEQRYETMPGYSHCGRNYEGFNNLECERYRSPAASETGLYSQLNENNYSELSRLSVKLLTPLGSGNFGQVLLGEYTNSEGSVVQVAIKTVKSGSKEVEKMKLLQEAAIMGQFVHPNVVRLVGIVTVGEPLMVVLEYMPKGDLCSFLHKMNPRRNKMAALSPSLPSQFIAFAKDIASGMLYLSKKGFVHRDLAARNVLLTNDLTCKIGDFGMARDIEYENEYYVSHGGVIPVKWTAPEALNHRKYTSASDVWSYGMVLFEIWSLGEKPFSDLTNPIAIALINSKHCQPPPPGCPRAIYQLMIQCWNPEHSCRPTFDNIRHYLNSDEGSLLQWLPEDMIRNKQAHILGAAMSEAINLYSDLQRTYQQHATEKQCL